MKGLQDDVERLQKLIEPLINNEPNVFIKPENADKMDPDEVEEGQPDLNKWSVYSAYRYLVWSITSSVL